MRTPGAALVLVLGLVVSGCSASEAEPTPLPPVPSASPTAAPVPSPPAEAAAETADGASAFARYYVELVDSGFVSGDSSAVRAASAPGCEGCESLVALIEGLKEQGRTRRGGEFVVKEVASPPVQNGDVVLLLTYERTASEVVDRSGVVVATAAPVPLTTAQMRLIRRDGSWIVQGYRTVQG